LEHPVGSQVVHASDVEDSGTVAYISEGLLFLVAAVQWFCKTGSSLHLILYLKIMNTF